MFNISNKPFLQLELNDLSWLIEERVKENAHIEYKSEINREKLDFCKEIAAFANSSGGILIFGVKEEKQLPLEFCGIDSTIANKGVDEWFSQVIMSNIEPKVAYEKRTILLDDNKILFLISIDDSSDKPHMYKERYYVRYDSISRPATHYEVRNMFEISRIATEATREFLIRRNLWDVNDVDFGMNPISKQLFNSRAKETNPTPTILFSFLPEKIGNHSIKTYSKEFKNWLIKNNKGYEPISNSWIISPNTFEIYLEYEINRAITIDKSYRIVSGKHTDTITRYTEFHDNGFVEFGESVGFYFLNTNYDHNQIILSRVVAFSEALLTFICEYYRNFEVDGLCIFQLSFVNAVPTILGGLYREEQYIDPENQRFCKHNCFKIPYRIMIDELSKTEYRKEIRDYIALTISRAYGLPNVLCFDHQGNYNHQSLQRFRVD